MIAQNSELLKNISSNLKVDLEFARCHHTGPSWHWINCFPPCNRLYYFLSGEGCIEINHVKYYPKSGDMMIVPANTLQSLYNISKNYFFQYYCHFLALVGNKNLFDIIQVPYIVHVQDDKELVENYKELVRISTNIDIASSLRSKSLLLNLISIFLQTAGDDAIALSEDSFMPSIRDVLHYIDQHLTDELSVDTLAEIASFHPNYFMKIFKQNLGCSMIEYVTKARITRAKQLLLYANKSIGETAILVGYANPAYFSRVFKDTVGVSPTFYKNNKNA